MALSGAERARRFRARRRGEAVPKLRPGRKPQPVVQNPVRGLSVPEHGSRIVPQVATENPEDAAFDAGGGSASKDSVPRLD